MKTILVISPHLDDAVLSCGAALKKWVSEGFHIRVQTVFSSAAADSPEDIQKLYIRRRSDDLKACELLDSKAVHSGFVDAPFRDPKYKDFSSILFHHTLDDQGLYMKVEKALLSLCIELKPDRVLFPLGIGGHVDHHLVFSCSRTILEKGFAVCFYEEFPYAQVDQWNLIRCLQTGALKQEDTRFSSASPMPVFRTLESQRLSFVNNYIVSKEDAARSEVLYEKEFMSVESFASKTPVWVYSEKKFKRQTEEITDLLDLKWQAITSYSTEWPALFSHRDLEIEKNPKQSHHGVHKEVFWKIL